MALELDKSRCDTYNQKIEQELENYTKVVNEIGSQASGISGAWSGGLSDNFVSQFNAFLPNLTIGFNIIEKSGSDLATSAMNITNTDERGVGTNTDKSEENKDSGSDAKSDEGSDE